MARAGGYTPDAAVGYAEMERTNGGRGGDAEMVSEVEGRGSNFERSCETNGLCSFLIFVFFSPWGACGGRSRGTHTALAEFNASKR